MKLRLHSVSSRPDLRARRGEVGDVFPEFMYHDSVSDDRWPALYTTFPECQFFLVDEDVDRVVAEGNSIPVPWGPNALPPDGWRRALLDGYSSSTAVALSALAIVIAPDRQGEGLGRLMLDRMRAMAAEQGFSELVAPVRPSLKAAYPLTPIERYVSWRTDEGLPFDPWLRAHVRAGGEIVSVAPCSMEISGSLSDWGEWAGMQFPESGRYVVTGALVPVEVDVEADQGLYVEPNVWVRHPVGG